MIKIEDIRVGTTVYHKEDVTFKRPYTIFDTNSRMKVNNEWVNCIIYKPEYLNNHNYFTRTVDSFMSNFSLKPYYDSNINKDNIK